MRKRKVRGTQTKDTEQRRQLLEGAVESAINAIIIMDLKANVLYCNSSFLDAWGFDDAKQVHGRKFSALWKTRKKAAEVLDALREGHGWVGELTAKSGDGTPFDVQASFNMVLGGSEMPVCMMGTFTDITSRKRRERAVLDDKRFLSDIFEGIQDGISILDSDLRVIRTNHWMEKMYSRSLPLVGKKCYGVYHGRKKPCEVCPSLRTLRTGKPAADVVPYPFADGGEGWMLLNTYPLVNDAGEVVGVIEHVKDVTEQKRAEKAVRESEEQFKNLAEESPNMIFINRGGRVAYANKMCAKVMGYSREEFLAPDFDFKELIAPEHRERVGLAFARHMKGGQVEPYEYALVTKDGGRLETIITTKLIDYRGGKAILGIVTDITERKRQTAELERTRFALDHAPMAVYWVGRDSRFQFVNEAACRLMGYTRDEFEAMGVYDIDVDFPKDAWEAHWRKMRKEGSFSLESVHRKKDGTEFPVEITVNLVRYGGQEYNCAIVRDISDRRRADKALRDSEARLRAALDALPFQVFAQDRSGRYSFQNKVMEAAAGRIVGKRVEEVAPDQETLKLWRSNNRRAFGGERVSEEASLRFNGRDYSFHNIVVPIPGKEGVREILGVNIDVTERKRAEEELRKSEEKWRSLVESSPNIIMIAERDGTLRFISRVLEGYDIKDVVGTTIYDHIAPDHRERARKAHERVIETGRGGQYDARIVLPSGREIWYQTAVGPIMRDGRVEAVIHSAIDVTASRRAEAELYQAQKLASVGQLAAGVAHEINNPLSALSGEIQWMMEKVEDPKLSKSLKFMDKVSMRIALIVSNLLAFSRETSHEAREFCGLNALLDRALMLMERRFESGRIEVVRDFDNKMPDLILNRGQIEQVFTNLLLNSYDAMPRGGKVMIRTRFDPARETAEAVIADTGCGIPAKDLSRIFDPFFTTKPPGRGTGLGLSVSHGIITKHKGSIRIESGEGGATVRVELPVKGEGT